MATKKTRIKIWEKSNGVCWYCGGNLEKGNWHIDHVIPKEKWRWQKSKQGQDDFENLVPSCPPCNILKHAFTLEQFRQIVQTQLDKCNRHYSHYRTAKRFGLIIEKPREIKFWFEENKK